MVLSCVLFRFSPVSRLFFLRFGVLWGPAPLRTWMAAKLVRKKCNKPVGKSLSAHPDVLRNSPFALAAFVGQLVRTSAALQEAGLAELAQPMLAHMRDLGC